MLLLYKPKNHKYCNNIYKSTTIFLLIIDNSMIIGHLRFITKIDLPAYVSTLNLLSHGRYLSLLRARLVLSSVCFSVDNSLSAYGVMSYAHNYYNYQVAVIFAILLGGILLLALVIGVIYFVCVNNMRDDDKKRLHHSRNSPSWPAQAPSYSAPYRERPSSTTLYNPTVAGQQQSYEFVPRSPLAASPTANISTTPIYNPPTTYTPNPQYSQAPLVTPVSQEYVTGNRVPQLQPEVIYTQGPISHTQTTPVEYIMHPNLPAYHQSSV